MHRILEIEKHAQLLEDIDEIKKCQQESGKMYAAIRVLQGKRKHNTLLINTENGVTTNEHTQVEIISEFYQKQFNAANCSGILDAKPHAMKTPFGVDEVKAAIKTLRNNKAAGIDQIKSEHLKNSPDEIPQIIADIFNTTAETGNNPMEIKVGILTPLIKNLKNQGPCTNLRPIILLSLLRKILAICMINRIGKKLEQHIPHSQSAYQRGRSTTEQVFTYKLLAEKAISSADYNVHILLMDMSKAFDTINREKLMNDLRRILEPDELHIMKVLLEGVQYHVRVGRTTGQAFTTNTGCPQGDCLSAILFAFYLAISLGYELHLKDHTYALPRPLGTEPTQQMQEHSYSLPPKKIHELCKQCLNIDTQYADDCGHAIVGNSKHLVNYIKATIPALLRNRDLFCNESKNEEYEVNYENRKNGKWRKCKCLGSLLDTQADIKRRKSLAIEAMKTLNDIWSSSLSISHKVDIFNCLIKSIFLYNSSLWTVTNTIKRKIDSFHRRLLRTAINFKYPKKISNDALMAITKQKSWSSTINVQRLRWFGHCMRLPDDSPAQQALKEFEREVPRPRGRPVTTWIHVAKKQINELGLSWQEAKTIALDRVRWRTIVNNYSQNT